MPTVHHVLILSTLCTLTASAIADPPTGHPRDRPAAPSDAASREAAMFDDAHRPAVPAVPIRTLADLATPPYSDRAVLADAWTRAWLVLDVDEGGAVTRLKFLNRPGFELEPNAIAVGFKRRFHPARDARGRPVASFVIWPIEWPAQSWLRLVQGLTTRRPGALPSGKNKAELVPCAGNRPFAIGKGYNGYRDCSLPDLDHAAREPWILPPP